MYADEDYDDQGDENGPIIEDLDDEEEVEEDEDDEQPEEPEEAPDVTELIEQNGIKQAIDEIHDVLSITAKKLKGVTLGRKYTTNPKPKSPSRPSTPRKSPEELQRDKDRSECANCGEKGPN